MLSSTRGSVCKYLERTSLVHRTIRVIVHILFQYISECLCTKMFYNFDRSPMMIQKVTEAECYQVQNIGSKTAFSQKKKKSNKFFYPTLRREMMEQHQMRFFFTKKQHAVVQNPFQTYLRGKVIPVLYSNFLALKHGIVQN